MHPHSTRSTLAMRLRALAFNLLEIGTHGYSGKEKRRLMGVNAAAHAATIVGVVLLATYLLTDPRLFRWVILINVAMLAVSLMAPALHRFGEMVAAPVLIGFAWISLFAVSSMLGAASGLHLIILAAPALIFVMYGTERLWLAVETIGVSILLYLLAERFFVTGTLGDAVSPGLLFGLNILSTAGTTFIVASVLYYVLWLNERAERQIEELMLRTFPHQIAARLIEEPDEPIAEDVVDATVLFSDLRGFVPLSRSLGAARTVELLNHLVSGFDQQAVEHGVERVKTIGDAYMAVAGASEPTVDHAQRMAAFAFATQEVARLTGEKFAVELALRIGIASGQITAGVIGTQRFSYDVWGDTVNLAARLEAVGEAGRILVSDRSRMLAQGEFEFVERGPTDIKGIGQVNCWLLVGRRDSCATAHAEQAPPHVSGRNDVS